MRPNADTAVGARSCLAWRADPRRAVPHVVLAAAPATGGQWTSGGGGGVGAIGTLSYAEMLSLPGYSFAEHHARTHGGAPLPELTRPSRAEASAYFAAYPAAAGISGAVRTACAVESVARCARGFVVQPFGIVCRHLVLASGIHDHEVMPPSPLFRPLRAARDPLAPVLVVGSGFSAADAIIAAPPGRRILHVYRWDPEGRPSPLRGCHRQAYPEYACVYRQMKAAALGGGTAPPPLARKKSDAFSSGRDWAAVYEGFPNATVDGVIPGMVRAIVHLRLADGSTRERAVGGLQYHVGRRGSLGYLDPALWNEVVGGPSDTAAAAGSITSRTLRRKAEADTEVAPAVFITGSLTGDTLVRHAYGACVHAAGRIMGGGRVAPVKQSARPAGLFGVDGAVGVEHEDMYRDRRQVASQ